METENNYTIKGHSVFIDNIPNLNSYPAFINKATIHNNAVLLIFTNNSDNKVCIPKYNTIDTYKLIDNSSYSINEIALTAIPNKIKVDAQTNPTQKTHIVETPIYVNALRLLKWKRCQIPKSANKL